GHDCDGGGECQRPGEKPAKANPSGREERRTDPGRIQEAGEGAGPRPAPRGQGQVRRQIHLEGARTDQQGTEQVQQAHLQTKAQSPVPQLNFCNASVKEGGVEARIHAPSSPRSTQRSKTATKSETTDEHGSVFICGCILCSL